MEFAFQITLGGLLVVSTYLLSQSALAISRLDRRMDRMETRMVQHCENYEVHKKGLATQ